MKIRKYAYTRICAAIKKKILHSILQYNEK